MDSLPLFLSLIKNSILINTLLTTGNFNNIDLSEFNTRVYSQKAIEFINFRLSENDMFDTILYSVIPSDSSGEASGLIQLTLTTKESKYFDNFQLYFQSGKRKSKFHRISDFHLDLGYFQLFEPPFPPAFVSIIKNPQYGYGVYISFYEDYLQRIKVWEHLFGG